MEDSKYTLKTFIQLFKSQLTTNSKIVSNYPDILQHKISDLL